MPDFSTMAQMMQNAANPQPRGMPIMRGVAAPAPAGPPMPPPGMEMGGGGMPPGGGGDPQSALLQQIVQLFQQQTGRMPTQEEMQAILAQVSGSGGPPGVPSPGGGGPMPGQGGPMPNTSMSAVRR